MAGKTTIFGAVAALLGSGIVVTININGSHGAVSSTNNDSLVVYDSPTPMQTPKGFILLHDPSLSSPVVDIKKDASFGAVRAYTTNQEGVFYMSEHSYTEKQKGKKPLWMYPIK